MPEAEGIMRIVIDMQCVQTGSRYRGIGRYVLSLARAMVRNKGEHEILLALNGAFNDFVTPIREAFHGLLPRENIRLWFAPGPTDGHDPANMNRRVVAEQIREAFLMSLQPDVVLIASLLAEGWVDASVASIGELGNTIPNATILYDLFPLTHPDSLGKSENFIRFYSRQLGFLKKSHLLLAISESTRQEGIRALSMSPSSIINISAACDPMFRVLEKQDGHAAELLSRLRLGKPFILYVGSADDSKNLHRLIQAFAALPYALRSRHQLLFAGGMPADYIHAFYQTARQSGLEASDLLVAGYISDDDLILLYNTCALFVFPSLREGFGLPPLEAMACGAPVIAANTTSLPDVIGREDALFDPYSVESISEKIREVLTDEPFRRKLIADGLAQSRKFSWDLAAQEAIAALEGLEGLVSDKTWQSQMPLTVEKTMIFAPRAVTILLLKLDHLGDFLLALPAISRLRARYPYAEIDIVVGSWNVALAEASGLFRKVYSFDYYQKKSSTRPETTEDAIQAFLERLGAYDIAIDLRRHGDTRFLLARVRASLRVGYQSFDAGIDSALHCVLPSHLDVKFKATPLNKMHITEQMMALVDALPADPSDYVRLPALKPAQTAQPGYVAIFPKAGTPTREWEQQNFAELVGLLSREEAVDAITVYFASEQEASAWEAAPTDKVQVRAGLPLPELITSLSEHSVCVANNSGGAHLAAYLGATVVAIYSGHETAEEWAPPFGESYVIHRGAACSPCHHGPKDKCVHDVFCLREIPVDLVFHRVMEAIRSRERPGTPSVHTGHTGSFFKDSQDCIKQLLPVLAKLNPGALPAQNRLELAQCLAASFPRQDAKKQLLVDISELVRRDAKTGIQRVVRSLLLYMLKNPPGEYSVVPIYFPDGGARFLKAVRFTKNFLGLPLTEHDIDSPIDYAPGDIYFGLDLNPSDLDSYGKQIRNMHNQGVKTVFLVYDLLCLTMKNICTPQFAALFKQWLVLTTEADGVICVSNTTANEYKQWLQENAPYRLPYITINWSHNGASLEQSCPSLGLPDSAAPILQKLSRQRSFLMVGTLEPRKGHLQAIKAFERLWARGHDVILVIVGKHGWQVDGLVKKLKRHPEQGRCLFWLEGISGEYLEKVYAACSCLIAASEGEGFGLPLVEAARRKLPLIVRDIPVFREVAGEHAWYFSGKQAEDLAESVTTWLRLYETGEHPRADNMPWLTWEQSAKNIIAILLHDALLQANV
jgi:glycosyltransferase involved in cell wall biosynthesis/ADP-heptose:LPS heptosyltransferase